MIRICPIFIAAARAATDKINRYAVDFETPQFTLPRNTEVWFAPKPRKTHPENPGRHKPRRKKGGRK